LGLIGTTTQSDDNLFSTIITEIFNDSDEQNSLIKRLGLNIKAVLQKLGMQAANRKAKTATFTTNSFFGSLIQLLLPVTKPATNPTIEITEASFEVDLMGL
jgi:hypothetical protein